MKSQHIVFNILCLLFSVKNQAQTQAAEPERPATRYEIGVNSTAFFKQFVSFANKTTNDTSVVETPYHLIGKKQFKKGYLRFGVGASINSANESSNKTADYKIKNNNDYQVRIGYEWQKKVSSKALLYYGCDILGGLNDKTIHSNSGLDFVTIENKTWMAGIAPVGGLRFEIFKNIALATESSIRFRYLMFEDKAKFSKNTDFNEKGQILKTSKLDFIAPTTIYVTVLF
jgi:hypothetical protein